MRFEFSATKSYFLVYSNIDTETNVYIIEKDMSKMKTAKHLGTLLVIKGGNDINFTEGRIASARRSICGFM